MTTYFAATSIGNAEARDTAAESVGQLFVRPIEGLMALIAARFHKPAPRR